MTADPVLKYLYRRVGEETRVDEKFSLDVCDYILDYLDRNSLSIEDGYNIYTEFLKNYNKHQVLFNNTGKYPRELKVDYFLKRLEYDVVLLFSIVLSPHRYRLVLFFWEFCKRIRDNQSTDDNVAFVGCGPGLELYLAKQILIGEIYGFDISLNTDLGKMLKGVNLIEAEFPPTSSAKLNKLQFSVINMIELLEHVEDPLGLIRNCVPYLTKQGCILLTTATDIPQFDHVYNFPSNHADFEGFVADLGLEIESCEVVNHNYVLADSTSKNHIYILKNVNN